jgi:hypothetical protein
MAGRLAFELLTQARTRVLAVGLILAVGYEALAVVLPPVVNWVAVTAAVAVPGTNASEQTKVTARTKERRSPLSWVGSSLLSFRLPPGHRPCCSADAATPLP